MFELQQKRAFLTVHCDSRIIWKNGAERFEPAEKNFLGFSQPINREPATSIDCSTLSMLDPMLSRERSERVPPRLRLFIGDEPHIKQRIVDFLRRLGLRPDFITHALDGGRV